MPASVTQGGGGDIRRYQDLLHRSTLDEINKSFICQKVVLLVSPSHFNYPMVGTSPLCSFFSGATEMLYTLIFSRLETADWDVNITGIHSKRRGHRKEKTKSLVGRVLCPPAQGLRACLCSELVLK